HPLVAEGGFRLALGRRESLMKVVRIIDAAHALAATAGTCLDEDRIADLPGLGCEHDKFLRLAVIARNHRYARALHQPLCRVLEAHGPNCLCRRADEDEPDGLHHFHEVWVFRKEAVTWMDRLSSGRKRGLDY